MRGNNGRGAQLQIKPVLMCIRLAAWARGWSEELGAAIDELIRNPTGAGVIDAQGRVSA